MKTTSQVQETARNRNRGSQAGNGQNPLADKQTMGAAVVSGTLDTLNSDPMTGKADASYAFQKQVLGAHAGLGVSAPDGGAAPLADKQTMGAAVVSGTLDNMNTDPISGDTDPSYSFQKDVLGAFAGLGSIVNKNG
ncbi:MAG: hypothetical protein V3573_02660 [Desulfovibrionaceae bacterium]